MAATFASSASLNPSPVCAANEVAEALASRLDGPVSLLTVFATEAIAKADVVAELARRFPGVPIFGGTSCRGLITEAGAHVGPHVTGVLAISDPAGSYATGFCAIADDARGAARQALETALSRAGRPYEIPALIWTCQPPGLEEDILAGFADVVGAGCPIMGGSSADETISGGWRQFSQDGTLENSVAVAVLFPTPTPALAFKSGYFPTQTRGRVTRSDRRRLLEIDGRPAAEVYAEWTGGRIDPRVPGMILQESTPAPLARCVGTYAGVDEFLLSHPASVEPDGALTLFAEVAEGEELHLMTGSREGLIERGGWVALEAREAFLQADRPVAGGLLIYCGGCMLAVADNLDEVAHNMAKAFDGAPFLAAFTFGEQGGLVSSGNRHGNLMIAATVFADE